MTSPTFNRPLRIKKDNFTHNLWGGTWIPRLKNLRPGSKPVGESWEFSLHPSRPSRVEWNGKLFSLPELMRRYRRQIGGDSSAAGATFLLKFIDAQDDLSVQVHPNDRFAKRHENDSGKTEAWLILDSGKRKGDGLIYVGFKKGAGRRKKFRAALERANALGVSTSQGVRKKAERWVLPHLNRVRVRAGEIYLLEAGTVHAIGRGVRVFEIQQSSDLTYRVWDWNRPDPGASKRGAPVARPLHLEKAFQVLEVHSALTRIRKKPRLLWRKKSVTEEQLVAHKKAGFAMNRLTLKKGAACTLASSRLTVLTVIEGMISLAGEKFSRGETALVPASMKRCDLRALKDAVVIKSYTP